MTRPLPLRVWRRRNWKGPTVVAHKTTAGVNTGLMASRSQHEHASTSVSIATPTYKLTGGPLAGRPG